MVTVQRLVGPLRLLLGVAFVVLLSAQLRALPASYDDWVRTSPDSAAPAWLLTVAVLVLLSAQVVVVCTWKLLAMVRSDRIFTDGSFVWVDTILGAIAAACVLLLIGFLYAAAPGRPPGSTAAVLLMLMFVAAGIAGLLMVVMRALLRRATSLSTELEAVV